MTNVLLNGGSTINAQDLFKQFVEGGINVRCVLPVGEHQVQFDGLEIDTDKMEFRIKFSKDGKNYVDIKKFKPEKVESINISLGNLARQLKMEGNISFNDINNHIGKELTVWACQVEGYTSTFYNYSAPKQTLVTGANEVVEGRDF
jgi:hypothetical protein